MKDRKPHKRAPETTPRFGVYPGQMLTIDQIEELGRRQAEAILAAISIS